jgi:hypothetical protein
MRHIQTREQGRTLGLRGGWRCAKGSYYIQILYITTISRYKKEISEGRRDTLGEALKNLSGSKAWDHQGGKY